jgi:hypothetical protein
VDLVAAVVADEQSLVVVEPRERPLDDPAGTSEPGAVFGLTTRDLRCDPAGTELAPVLVVVIASVGGDPVGSSTRAADLAAHGRNTLDERDELSDVVAVTASDRPRERDPGRVYEEVMLRAVSASINRARARRGAPFFACT